MRGISILLFLIVTSASNFDAEDWDYIVFTQAWPESVCKDLIHANFTSTCNFPRERAWTIHGLWPTLMGKKGPDFCNQTWSFDLEEVKPLASELEQRWINLIKDEPSHSFWAHEWNKHGTCGATIEPLNSQIKYFSAGLDWLQKYSMTTILSDANIVPTDTRTYTANEIHNAVYNKLGVNPEITCKNFVGKQYLFEIRICFSRQLEIMDCAKKYDPDFDGVVTNNCNSTGIFYF